MENNLKNIPDWVQETFDKSPKLETQNFNVATYSQREKDEAMLALEVKGFIVELENNGNSLKVTKT